MNQGETGTFLNPFIFTYGAPPTQYAITASAGPNGSISPSGNVSVTEGGNKTFYIYPSYGYSIQDVVVDGISQGALTSYTFTNVVTNHTIQATFQIKTYVLSYLAGSYGSITGQTSQIVSHGGNGTAVTAVPDNSFTFIGWSDGSFSNPRTDLNITSNLSVTASFSSSSYVITATAGTGGSISPSGQVIVAGGANKTFSILPAYSYQIADVFVDGNSVGAIASYTFTNVGENHTIEAVFSLRTYTLNYLAGSNGSISGQSNQLVSHGGTGTSVRAVPNSGFAFDSWSDGSLVNPRRDLSVVSNINVTASFISTEINPGWHGSTGMQYNMQIVCKIMLAGGGYAHQPTDLLAAFVGMDCRGTASPLNEQGLFFLTVNSNVTSGETVAFKCYLGSSHELVILNERIPFVNQGEVGTFNEPYILTYDNNITDYFIQADAAAHGSISPQGNILVPSGQSQQFTIAPASGYSIASVLVDGVNVGPVSNYQFSNVTQNHSIAASFSANGLTITASADPNGSITPSGAVAVNCGASQTFNIVPVVGFHVADVLVDGTSVGAVTTYTFNNVTENHTIVASFAGDELTIAASAGPNGSISPSGTVAVNYGANQTFNIAPAIGFHLADVLVDGTSVGAVTTYTFNNVTENHTIAASFSVDGLTITASAGPNGSITPSGAVAVNYGANQTFNIQPAIGFHVADVLVDDASVGAVTTYTFNNVTENHTIAASFAINIFTITASAGPNGNITPSGAVAVNYGANQTFNIQPAIGFHVANVLVDGASVGAVTTYTFNNVTENHTIAASFAGDGLTITATAGPNGSITPSGAVAVNYGASQTFNIVPVVGFHVADVLVDGTSVGAVTTYTFNNVTENHTIVASFAGDELTIAASAGPNGSITPNGAVAVNYGASQTFNIQPAIGFHVADVLVDGISVGAVTTYTFTNVTENHTIAASFAINTLTITASAGPNGSITPSGAVAVSYGANQTFNIQPAIGFHVADVLVDGASVGALTSYTFNNVIENHTIAASFAINTFTITASAGPNGSISPNGAVAVNYGESLTFDFYPNEGFEVCAVYIDGDSIGNSTNYSFSNINADHDIFVSFALISHTIENVRKDLKILLYPIPAKEYFVVKISRSDSTDIIGNYQLFDLNGLMVLTGTFTTNQFNISTSVLIPGAYIILVTINNEQLYTVKFNKVE